MGVVVILHALILYPIQSMGYLFLSLVAAMRFKMAATYGDIAKGLKIHNDIQDELKPNLIDLNLPYEDYNSGWVYPL